MSQVDNKHLPAILCLHGGGASAVIFQFQTIQLRHALRNHFRFVFANAPLESGPGPDVVPVFERLGPYYMWAKVSEPTNQHFGLDATLKIIENYEAKEGPFVGILGFSQGTMLGLGLLQRDQQLRQQGKPTAGYLFGAFVGGSRPPLPISESVLKKGSRRLDHRGDELVNVPTIHAWGSDDKPVQENRGRQLRFCNHKKAKTMDYKGGHQMPKRKEDTLRLAQQIISVYDEEMRNREACSPREDRVFWW